MRWIVFPLLFLLMLSSCVEKGTGVVVKEEKRAPRNVILMIGDGMGLNQMYAGLTANGGHLAMERCTATAMVKTYSANRYITDSAAAGTALACGKKSNNGMIGMDADSVPAESLLEYYRGRGYATGIVVTSPVTHATPAAFYAHVPNRGEYEEIARQLYGAGVDFFCGGGRSHFEERSDSVSYTDSLVNAGYDVVYSIDSVQVPALLPCAVLAADVDMPAARERGDFLPRATETAIKSLKAKAGDRGFFLMVEGSQIDYRCHGNDGEGMVAEVLDFDRAVRVALDFAAADGNTLVVVTADHETGGVTIVDGEYETGMVEVSFGRSGQAGTSVGHTGTCVPLFAFGRGAELFAGMIDNTEVAGIIRKGEK